MSASNSKRAITLWDIHPPHSSVYFRVCDGKGGYLGGELRFSSGCIRTDESNLANVSIVATLDASSIETGEQDRDNRLRSAAFLDTTHYPEITFLSKTVAAGPHRGSTIVGDLTMHGRTEEITIVAEAFSPVTRDHENNVRCGTSAMLRLNPAEFGLNWNPKFAADEVSVTIGIELIERKQDFVLIPDDVVVGMQA